LGIWHHLIPQQRRAALNLGSQQRRRSLPDVGIYAGQQLVAQQLIEQL
jgi:hypothetical protein